MQVSSKSSRGVLNFNIQLLSGKNVVLVNCPGYESELFMPQIVKGRINFQNIIPNRRCCKQANLTISPLSFKDVDIEPSRCSTLVGSPAVQRARFTSTPHRTEFSMRARTKGGKENISPPMDKIMTPDQQLRCNTTQSQFSLNEDLNVSQNHSTLEKTFSGSHLVLPNQLVLADKQTELDLSLRMPTPTRSFYNAATAKILEPVICSFIDKAQAKRTYARRKSNATSKSKSPFVWSPLQKRKKVSSTASSTKAPNPPMTLELRRRKLIVDNKKCLSTLNVNKMSSPITKKKIIRKQVTGRTKKQFEALKTTAFDLLTTPSHSVSKTLNQQFKQACIDKRATTLTNYAEVAATRPLQIDREVKSLISKRKRFDSSELKRKCRTRKIIVT